jgi:hypothetical protein
MDGSKGWELFTIIAREATSGRYFVAKIGPTTNGQADDG